MALALLSCLLVSSSNDDDDGGVNTGESVLEKRAAAMMRQEREADGRAGYGDDFRIQVASDHNEGDGGIEPVVDQANPKPERTRRRKNADVEKGGIRYMSNDHTWKKKKVLQFQGEHAFPPMPPTKLRGDVPPSLEEGVDGEGENGGVYGEVDGGE
ncbi:hypothetical protein HK101_004984, partial [Irineochytrium annulatum]